MHDRYVLDSFALLAFLQDEPGGERIQELLREASEGGLVLLLSIVNYGEILYQRERRGGLDAVQEATRIIDNLPIRVVDADRRLTFAAAHIKAVHPIAYADAFAAALATREDAVLVTGDPEFAAVEGTIRVEWLR